MNICKVVALAAMASAMAASAQEACPGGTQVGQDCRGGYCVPICAYDESPQAAQSTAAPRVVERWEVFDDRFGAIALAPNGVYGTSWDRVSEEEAETAALALCEERGGDDCRLKGGGANRNACGTLAWGGGVAMVEGAATREQSEREALNACNEDSGVPCEVIETFCSTPVSRWVYQKPDDWVPKRD